LSLDRWPLTALALAQLLGSQTCRKQRITAVLARPEILQRAMNDAESPNRRKVGWSCAAQDAVEAMSPRPEETEPQPLVRAVASGGESVRSTGRRSTPAAVILTFLVVVPAAVILIVVVALADAVAGSVAGIVAAIAAQIAVLAFVTLRAYPPGAKVPWATFVVLTILITALLPLIYMAWLWVTKKKWHDAGLEHEPPPAGAVPAAAPATPESPES